jgi:hypothetical protein
MNELPVYRLPLIKYRDFRTWSSIQLEGVLR